MKVLEHVEVIRHRVKAQGDYVRMSGIAGVSDSWLVKFANGKIPNPTVDSIDKLEQIYCQESEPCAR